MSNPDVNPIAKAITHSRQPNERRGNVRRRRPFYRSTWFAVLALLILIGGATSTLVVFAYISPLREQAATFDLDALHKIEKASLILDRRGAEVSRLYMLNRTPIKIEQVPMHFIQALTAQEDERYFQHSGVDFVGIMRAMWLNYKAGSETQGASTITQQLAREAFKLKDLETDEKNSRYNRKIIEWFAAERIETKYTKSEILELYLNRIYFGGGFYGIQAAAKGYYGKDVSELNIGESATLCGIIKSPNNLQPLRHPERARKVRDHVLDRMVTEGYLSREESAAIKAVPTPTVEGSRNPQQSYVYEAVRQETMRIIGSEAALLGGFNIYTTIDSRLQKAAELAVEKHLAETEQHPGYPHQTYAQYHSLLKRHKTSGSEDAPPQPEYLQGAVLAIDNRDGGILALVGGRDFSDSEYNRALQSRRPAGTAFIPFIYAAAFQSPKFYPPMALDDRPMDNRRVMIGGFQGILGEWGAEKAKDTSFKGTITAREALAQGRNAASVGLGEKIGLESVKKLAQKIGITSPIKDYPSSYLGASEVRLDELCLAYSTFAGRGKRPRTATLIHRITDYEGKIIYQADEENQTPIEVLDEIAAWQTHSCLVDALVDGTGKAAYTQYGLAKFPAAGKTGTHYEFKDLWFLGYTSAITCGVWSGFDQQKTIYEGAFSNRIALPIWTDIMNAAHKDYEAEVIPPPESAQMVEVCRTSGQRATDGCYEQVVDPVSGGMKAVRHTYLEALRPDSVLDTYCSIHPNSGLDLAPPQMHNPLASASQRFRPQYVNATPVRMKGLTLIGDDPYKTIVPIVRAEAVDDTGANVTRAEAVEDDATKQSPIKITPPPPLKLDLD